jgi:GH43 family beta-xylosidase
MVVKKPPMTFRDEITDFFSHYVDAFTRENADALSELWDEVGLFPTPTGNFAMERSAFRDHCVSLFVFYRSQGVIRPEGTLLSADELFPGVAQARIAYRMMDKDDVPVAEWEHVYILRHTDRWRVSLTIADGEMAAWTAKGVQLR